MPQAELRLPTLNDISEQNHVFGAVAAYRTESANFSSGVGMPERVQLQDVSQAYFSLLDVAPNGDFFPRKSRQNQPRRLSSAMASGNGNSGVAGTFSAGRFGLMTLPLKSRESCRPGLWACMPAIGESTPA